MKKILLILLMGISFSGNSQGLWKRTGEEQLTGSPKISRHTTPVEYNLFMLSLPELKARLAAAPLRNSGVQSAILVPFPDADGNINHFRVYEAPVLHQELAARYPEIRSYTGQGVENPALSIRFSVTLFGLHAMLFSPEGVAYIDSYTQNLQSYIVYSRKALKAPGTFNCNAHGRTNTGSGDMPFSTQANDGVLRTYRLALACTVEYAAFHIGAAGVTGGTTAQKKAAVLAAMNVTMTRVNGVYERDLAITMEIVPDNEDIIFITSDNLSNNESMLNQIQPIINNAIGFNNYDIGHVIGTGDGGLATIASVCTTEKAQGVTGNPAPVGDPFDIDYVAHEMGHQFGAEHTFNATTGSCGFDNRNAATAVEPGSGTTIMGYAGICGPANIQVNSDPYFHTVSIDEIFNFVNSTGTCSTEIPNGNTPPVIAALQNYTIPRSTAFVLRGSATDADDDPLTYCWEQTDANGAAANSPTTFSTSGPNFRSLPPSVSPVRYMPPLQNVLNGNLAPAWQVLPAVTRTLRFALTVRDNELTNGGQTARRNMTVNVSNAGPFSVTSQNTTDITWQQGSQQTITWNVAGTSGGAIGTANVNILLSTDGGQTFTTVLAANTQNDGQEVITVPPTQAPFCRIMVEAVGNIYYAVNAEPFAIGAPVITACETYTNETAVAIPDSGTTFTTSVINVEGNAIITGVTVGINADHPSINELIIKITSPDGTEVDVWDGSCNGSSGLEAVFSGEGTAAECQSPTTGVILPAESLEALNGGTAAGEWTLSFIDPFPGNTGTLNSWTIEVCSQNTGDVDEAAFLDFMLYPNPNEGSFTLSFTPATNDVAVTVHDMRGRTVYEQHSSHTGNFTTLVNLANVQAGVYLVTVQDGNRKLVKKIIIQ